MMAPLLLLSGVIAASAAATVAMRNFSRRRALFDHPNDRSSHAAPIPRLGGVAIAAAMVAGWAVAAGLGYVAPGREWNALVSGALVMTLVGLADDLRSLHPASKFAGQLLAIAVVLAMLLPSPLLTGWLSAAIGIGWLLAYTNQFNFMDGSDGLAAGMSVVNALGIAALAVAAGRADIAWCALILAAAAAGFLWHNIAPASIFMGDTGSHVLGFTLALLVIFLIEAGVRPLAAVVLLAPFVIDTMVTLVRRWARGEVLWRAHRSHLYQHLLMNGWTARQVAWIYYAWGVWSALVAWLMTLTAYSGWAENAALVGAQLVPATIVAWLAARSLPRLDHQIQPEPVAQRSDQPSGIHAPGQRGHR